MRRESHVRSCESGRGRFPPATHQFRTLGSARGAARKGGPYRDYLRSCRTMPACRWRRSWGKRGLAEGNTDDPTRPGRSAGHDVPNGLDRVREVAGREKDARFTALLHHVDLDCLRSAYWAINPKAATGVDGVTWAAYGVDLEENLLGLLGTMSRFLLKFSGGHSVFRLQPDRTLRV